MSFARTEPQSRQTDKRELKRHTHTHTLAEPSRDDCCCSGKIPEMIYLIVKALLRGIWPIPPAYDVDSRRTLSLLWLALV